MKFFVDSGAIVSAQLTSEHYRQSTIVQGGMESHSEDTWYMRKYFVDGEI